MNVTDDMVEAATAIASETDNNLQGFLYGNAHVIRDISRSPGEQEVWRLVTDDYETGYNAMMLEIERMRMRAAIEAALASLAGQTEGEALRLTNLRDALFKIIRLDHHNHAPESRATRYARAAIDQDNEDIYVRQKPRVRLALEAALASPVGQNFAETLNFYISDSENGISYVPRQKLIEIQDAIRALSAAPAPPATGWQDIPVTDETLDYVSRYGGRCRDCADAFGVCNSGLPCKHDERRAAIRHVLRAINYGMGNGFLPLPTPPNGGAE